jgi:hypothetical protein
MIYSFAIYKKNAEHIVLLSSEKNVKSLGYFQRKRAREFMSFASRESVKRTTPNILDIYTSHLTHIKVDSKTELDLEYIIYTYQYIPDKEHTELYEHDDVYITMIVDVEYPERFVGNLLKSIGTNFLQKHKAETYGAIFKDQNIEMPILKETMKSYPDPKNNSIMQTNELLEDVLSIETHHLDKIFSFDQAMDTAIENSQDLSKSSKKFYHIARKLNKF